MPELNANFVPRIFADQIEEELRRVLIQLRAQDPVFASLLKSMKPHVIRLCDAVLQNAGNHEEVSVEVRLDETLPRLTLTFKRTKQGWGIKKWALSRPDFVFDLSFNRVYESREAAYRTLGFSH